MIYVTGDIHGDFSRFKDPTLRKLRKNDALIVCGDFGFIWDGSAKERKLLKKIGKLPYNVLFVEGSHDNYDLLDEYEVTEWCGGKSRLISGRLRQLMRGQVFEIAEKKIFTMGGGQTDDVYDLVENENWWRREVPDDEELQSGLDNLEINGNTVDFIITYEPPSRLQNFLTGAGEMNIFNTYLSKISEKVDFKMWFFGKLHINKLVPPKYHALYDNIVIADNTKIKRRRKPKKQAAEKNEEQ